MDPSIGWDNYYVINKINDCKVEKLNNKCVYISGIKGNKDPFVFDSTLRTKQISSLRCKYQYFEDEVACLDVVFLLACIMV